MDVHALTKQHLQTAVYAAFGQRLDSHELDSLFNEFLVHKAKIYGTQRLDDAELELAANHVLSTRKGRRFDAGETAIVAAVGALESKLPAINVLRPPAKARQLLPVVSTVDRGATTWSYEMWDHTGIAQVIENYAEDIEVVTAFASKFTGDVLTIAKGYDWTWDDVNKSAKAQVPLQTMKSGAVAEAFERRVDRMGAIGHEATNVIGLLNHPNVTIIAASAPATGSSTAWNGADKKPAEILADLIAMEDAIISGSKGIHQPSTLVLPLSRLRVLQTKHMYSFGSGVGENPTILEQFLKDATSVREVEFWHFCDTAGVSGVARACMYQRDARYIQFEIPVEQEELPAQPKGLALQVNSVGKVAGVRLPFPLSAVYQDGI